MSAAAVAPDWNPKRRYPHVLIPLLSQETMKPTRTVVLPFYIHCRKSNRSCSSFSAFVLASSALRARSLAAGSSRSSSLCFGSVPASKPLIVDDMVISDICVEAGDVAQDVCAICCWLCATALGNWEAVCAAAAGVRPAAYPGFSPGKPLPVEPGALCGRTGCSNVSSSLFFLLPKRRPKHPILRGCDLGFVGECLSADSRNKLEETPWNRTDGLARRRTPTAASSRIASAGRGGRSQALTASGSGWQSWVARDVGLSNRRGVVRVPTWI
jgi:hypothetical protein